MADVIVDPESTNPSELLGQGIKAYVLQDYEASVAALSRATELLVQEHEGNDLHDSLGEVYLYYGKALLGLSREQNEALGDAVPKDKDEESDDEDDEGIETEEVEAENAENEQNEENSKNEAPEVKNGTNEEKAVIAEATKEKNGEGKEVEKNGEAKANGEAAAANGAASNGEAGPSSSNAVEPDSTEDASQDDEPTDLQVAWEVLELAKKIYQRQGDSAKKNLADTLIILGEVSMESENFEAAVKDINEGLEIQKTLFTNDSRTVAETYYKLGMAYSTESQMTEAIESFGKSLEYLKNRIGVLEKLDPLTEEAKEEIEEIKGLIPDIEEKIVDMKSSKEEAIKKIAEAIRPKSDDGAGASSSSSSKQATNISHLVKRKRKPDENEGKEEVQPAKKSATESQ